MASCGCNGNRETHRGRDPHTGLKSLRPSPIGYLGLYGKSFSRLPFRAVDAKLVFTLTYKSVACHGAQRAILASLMV